MYPWDQQELPQVCKSVPGVAWSRVNQQAIDILGSPSAANQRDHTLYARFVAHSLALADTQVKYTKQVLWAWVQCREVRKEIDQVVKDVYAEVAVVRGKRMVKKVHPDVEKLSANGQKVYMFVFDGLKKAQKDPFSAFEMSLNDIRDNTKLAINTVRRTIQEMITAGLLVREATGGPVNGGEPRKGTNAKSVYRFLKHEG